MPVAYNTAAGNLTIGGVAMFCPAWKVDNVFELWLPAEQRGADDVRPNVAGTLASKRYATVTRKSLRMQIVGDVDRTGASTPNDYEGLYTNVAYLRDNVVAPTAATNGTRSAVLTLPDAATLTEPVHVVGLEVTDLRPDAGWALAILTISIPSGQFA